MSLMRRAGDREREHRYWTLAHGSVRSPATSPEGVWVVDASNEPKGWRCTSAIGEDPFVASGLTLQACGIYRTLPATGFHNPFQDVVETKVHAAKITMQKHAGSKVRAHLVRRLLELVDMAADEYPETDIPNQQTLDSVLSLFSMRRDVRDPMLGLTAAGSIWAEWRDGTQSAAIEFLRNGSVNLVAFVPDPEEPLRPASIAANLSWRSAARELRANPALAWIRDR